MRVTKKIIWACATSCALAIALLTVHAVKDYAQSDSGNASAQSHVPPWAQLDNAAVAARPDDETSVQALTQEVLNQPFGFPKLPSQVATPIVNRLVYAEVDFRSGRGRPVNEHNVVTMVNDLVKQLGLPNWAKVDGPEVRYIHMQALRYNPIFMGAGTIRPGMRVGDHIGRRMSPLQGFNLAIFVIGQKLISPDFQLAPGAWEAHQAVLESRRLQAFQGLMPGGKKHRPYLEAIQDLNSTQMMNALQNAGANMTEDDANALANHELDVLGVEGSGRGYEP